MQLKLPEVKPAKTAREHVREKLADLNLRQAERERRRFERRRRTVPPAARAADQFTLFS